jgi:hypothetical protein
VNGNAYINAGRFFAVRLADIIVPAYQREGAERSAIEVEKNLDPQLLQAITLVEIPENAELFEGDKYLVEDDTYHRTASRYVLVDGLQRCTGLARTHESDTLVMAQVFSNVARDRQVDLFIGLNRGNVRVKDYWIYKAKLQSGHPGVTQINDALTATNFKVVNGGVTGAGGNNAITAVGTLTTFVGVDLAHLGGDQDADQDALTALSNALTVINRLWPVGAALSTKRSSAAIVFGLATVFRYGWRKNGQRVTVEDVMAGVTKKGGAATVNPSWLIAEGNALKSKAVSATSGGGHSIVKYSSESWLNVINSASPHRKFALIRNKGE